jgi:serine O-acetyltransferase
MWPRLTRDFERMRQIKGWGTLHALADALILDSGFQALMLYRSGHTLRRWGIPFLPALFRRLAIAFCGIDILPRARIGGGCYIPHGVGIVVGGATVIGDDCTILQGVTFGEARFDNDDCPVVGDRVTIGAGAKLLGAIVVGDGASIGAGAVVLDNVPAGSVAVGVPARTQPPGPS